ncbi:MAG TPA: sugar transferase [Thermoanaerobaculia bacterium]|nr:sugar transferase [Thermoanaerobaculia bacterium]
METAAKRAFDLVGSALGLILLAPLLLVLAVTVAMVLGRPVLFRQQRAGLGGTVFTLVKLRSMSDERDATGALLPDAHRLGRFGRFLRASSLDELPTLWNVLKGEMSLVGPRPLLLRYLPRYSPEQARRHEVKPGITGWAQVNGRNALTWEQKFELDVWYVDHRSLRLDLAILAATIGQVFRAQGIRHGEEATSPEFLGSTPDSESTTQ